jgi:hypothetical protein
LIRFASCFAFAGSLDFCWSLLFTIYVLVGVLGPPYGGLGGYGLHCEFVRVCGRKKEKKTKDIELGSSYTLSILRQLQSFYVEYQI